MCWLLVRQKICLLIPQICHYSTRFTCSAKKLKLFLIDELFWLLDLNFWNSLTGLASSRTFSSKKYVIANIPQKHKVNLFSFRYADFSSMDDSSTDSSTWTIHPTTFHLVDCSSWGRFIHGQFIHLIKSL